jgi:hypothetical protein
VLVPFEIDYYSLMSSVADLFCFVACRDLEFNSLPVFLDNFGFGTDIVIDRRSGNLSYVYCGTDRALA